MYTMPSPAPATSTAVPALPLPGAGPRYRLLEASSDMNVGRIVYVPHEQTDGVTLHAMKAGSYGFVRLLQK